MKTLIYSSHQFEKPFFEKASLGKHKLVFTDKSLDKDTAILSKGFDAIVIFTSDIASAEVLKILVSNGLKYIALRSVGHDHVDLKLAKTFGIKVANVPAYSPHSIAEYSVALILSLNRKILLAQQLIQQNNYCLDSLVGFDLNGKTIGIVGTGKIGTIFAHIMKGFGCKLIGYDINNNKRLIKQTGIVYQSLDELCMNADIISVHCPLNETTKYMFNKSVFSKMKKGVYFINTARGGIVNTIDLIEAIDNGTIAAAGLDVYEYEKSIFFTNHFLKPIQDKLFIKLKSYPNVLITGHQAFLTNEALRGIAETTISNLSEFSQMKYSNNDLN